MIQSPESERDSVALIVREAISSILPNLPAKEISGEKSLADYGADSVDRVEIIISIMNRLGIDEPMSKFSEISTIDGLIEYLSEGRRK